MIINDYGFKIASGALTQGGRPTEAAAQQKTFLLEGYKDMYQALPTHSDRGKGEGPIYPTIGTRLFPALDALETTVGQLGKHPTPEDVDRSNVRRLIRAFQPVAQAFSDSYDKKDFKKSMKRLQKLASSLGKYKDVAVIEEQVKGISPGGSIPRGMQKKLDKLRQKRADEFTKIYKDFRKEDLKKALKILSRPYGVSTGDPREIQKQDRARSANHLHQLANELKTTGLVHREPKAFHEGRKSLRRFLNSAQSVKDTFGIEQKDMESMTDLVNTYGIAQDNQIAYEWLSDNGFSSQAQKMDGIYKQNQSKALSQAGNFLKSGTIGRVQSRLV